MKYFKRVDGTVYEYTPDGITQIRQLPGEIGPTTTDKVEWINLDNVSRPSTPTGV
jgi:hypothetical protein